MWINTSWLIHDVVYMLCDKAAEQFKTFFFFIFIRYILYITSVCSLDITGLLSKYAHVYLLLCYVLQCCIAIDKWAEFDESMK
jgi:hypothetical protein